MSLNESIIKIKCELQKTNIKKSGKNTFAGFEYFELADFLPTLNELMLKEGINDQFTIEGGEAKLCIMKDKEELEFKMPFYVYDTPPNKNGKPMMQDIQYLGAINTYYKRYLYLNAFGITDGEVIDKMDNSDLPAKPSKQPPKQAQTKTDYRLLVIKELQDSGIDFDAFAAQHRLTKDTTQDEFKELFEALTKEGG